MVNDASPRNRSNVDQALVNRPPATVLRILGHSKRRQCRPVNRRLVTDNKFVERASVALPGKQDELLVRHTPYRPFNRQAGWVRQQHPENVAPPAGSTGERTDEQKRDRTAKRTGNHSNP